MHVERQNRPSAHKKKGVRTALIVRVQKSTAILMPTRTNPDLVRIT